MRKQNIAITLLGTFCILAICWLTARSQAAKTVQVHMVITDAALRTEKSLPALNAENVKVKQGKSFLSVVQVIPSQGDNAALQLMILIDDTLNTQAVGNNLNDLKAFTELSRLRPSSVSLTCRTRLRSLRKTLLPIMLLRSGRYVCPVARLPPWTAPTYRSSAW